MLYKKRFSAAVLKFGEKSNSYQPRLFRFLMIRIANLKNGCPLNTIELGKI